VLPTGTSATIDGVVVVNGDRVLFTNLSSNNNRVYVVSGVGTALAWQVQAEGQAGSGAPTDGDVLDVQEGETYADRILQYTGTAWASITSTDMVTGPASATANAVARFSGPTGKIIKNSGVLIDDADNMTGVASLKIGAGALDSSAIAQFTSTTKGFLPPSMTTTQRDAIDTPAPGLFLFNNITAALNYYSGSAWTALQRDLLLTLTANEDLLVRRSGVLARLAVGSDGQVLTIVGGQVAWGSSSSGVTTVGAFGSSPNSAGALVSGSTLTLQPADASNPGGVSTAAQTFAGAKTFAAKPVFPQGLLQGVRGSDTTSLSWSGATSAQSGLTFYTTGGADFMAALSQGYRVFETTYRAATDRQEVILNSKTMLGYDPSAEVESRILGGRSSLSDSTGGFLSANIGQQVPGTGNAGIHMINSNDWSITNTSSYGLRFLMGYASNYGLVLYGSNFQFGWASDGGGGIGLSCSSPNAISDTRPSHVVAKYAFAAGYANGKTGLGSTVEGFFGPAGTLANPAFTSHTDTNTGMYFPAADTVGVSAGGIGVVQFDAGGPGSNRRLTSVAASQDLYISASANLYLGVQNIQEMMRFLATDSGQVIVYRPLRMNINSEGPGRTSYSFNNHPDGGLGYISSTVLGLSTAGAWRMQWKSGVAFVNAAASAESTGAGTPLLGTNCPASTLTAPYTWLKVETSDGSTVYIPAWK